MTNKLVKQLAKVQQKNIPNVFIYIYIRDRTDLAKLSKKISQRTVKLNNNSQVKVR